TGAGVGRGARLHAAQTPLRTTCESRTRKSHSPGVAAGGHTGGPQMIFEEIRTGGCCSYVIACGDTCAGVVIDPELSQIDRTLGLIAKTGIRVHYVVDTHTHADHFSASRELAQRLGVPRVMHRASIAPHIDVRIDDGETLIAGRLRMHAISTPGHTDDSMSL